MPNKLYAHLQGSMWGSEVPVKMVSPEKIAHVIVRKGRAYDRGIVSRIFGKRPLVVDYAHHRDLTADLSEAKSGISTFHSERFLDYAAIPPLPRAASKRRPNPRARRSGPPLSHEASSFDASRDPGSSVD